MFWMTDEQLFALMMQHVLTPTTQTHTPGTDRINLIEEEGVRYLHFGTPWVQGAMRFDDPYSLEIEYVQQMMLWMLFVEHPTHVVQLGLGAGSLSKFCWRHFSQARVTAVEIDSAVIDTCRTSFALPDDDQRLTVMSADAFSFVRDSANHGTVDILQVDLYDAHAAGPALGSAEFYQACADCLTKEGIMTINLFCDYPEHQDHLDAIGGVFQAVAHLPEVHDGNVVGIAFKQAPSVDFNVLSRRADRIHKRYGLPAQSWVDGLQAWMQGVA